MKDQATTLREMPAVETRQPLPLATNTPAFVIGSGKGGVGKSVISVTLASTFSRQGRRVLLLDGSQNQGNLHVLLGVRPAAKLDGILDGELSPESLLLPITDRLWLMPSNTGAEAIYSMSAVDRARVHHKLSTIYDAFDVVIIDAGPGLECAVRVSTMRASRLVVVAVPEPASLSDAYALIKIVNLQVPSIPIDMLVNRTVSEAEGRDTHERINLATQRFLKREISYLGCIPELESLRRAVRHPGELLGEVPNAVTEVARRLSAVDCMASENRNLDADG